MATTHIDLSHDIEPGLTTYPGLPGPIVEDHLSREAAEEIYGPGITFQIGLVTICTNTGTYLDVPFHRYADGHDLTGLALERVAAVDAVRIDRRGSSVIALDDVGPEGRARTAEPPWQRSGHSLGQVLATASPGDLWGRSEAVRSPVRAEFWRDHEGSVSE